MLEEKGAVVCVEVRPGGVKSLGVKKSGGGGGGEVVKVKVDGKEARVEGEKESLTSLGREELSDDRVGRMSVLTR